MISLILILLASLFFTGIVLRTKSITSGRKGPGIFQPMKDVARLFKKGSVYSTTTGLIFQVAPSIYFASVIMAILVVPFGRTKGIISFEGDFVFFAYVLATGKFFSIISALDTGSSFEGMGGKPGSFIFNVCRACILYPDGIFCTAHRLFFFPGDIYCHAFWFSYLLCIGHFGNIRSDHYRHG